MLQRHDDLEALCFAIGWIAHNWALVEQNFEMCIAIIYHDLDGKTLVSNKLPLPWNQKVEYLQKAFAKIPRLSRYVAEGTDLLDRADKLSEQRNDLVHGTLAKLHAVEGKWHLKIFDYDRSDKKTNWHVMREFKFGPSEFLFLEGRLVPLAGEVARWGHRLWTDIRPRGESQRLADTGHSP